MASAAIANFATSLITDCQFFGFPSGLGKRSIQSDQSAGFCSIVSARRRHSADISLTGKRPQIEPPEHVFFSASISALVSLLCHHFPSHFSFNQMVWFAISLLWG